jgi:predicted transcriptional regulator
MPAHQELSETVSIRLPTDVLQAIEAVAAASDRTRSWVMVRALKRYLATEGAEIIAVAEGRRQIAGGDFHEMDTVIDEAGTLVRPRKAT